VIGVDKKVEFRVSETDMEDVLEKHKLWHNTQSKEGEKAYMSEADLIGADLMNVMNIAEEQIESAIINDATNILAYLTSPAKRKKRVKKGRKE
jgi:alpha-L-arabinofuranosidase